MTSFLLFLLDISSTALAAPEESLFPVAKFSNNVTSGYAPLSIQFTDESILNEPNNSLPSSQQVITGDDNGKSIILKNGEIFYLKLREKPSTGYVWN